MDYVHFQWYLATKKFYQLGGTLIYSWMFKEEVEIIEKNITLTYCRKEDKNNF